MIYKTRKISFPNLLIVMQLLLKTFMLNDLNSIFFSKYLTLHVLFFNNKFISKKQKIQILKNI